jgi:amidase
VTPDAPLWAWPARELAAAIRRRDVAAREVMRAHLDRIAETNPRVGAIVAMVPEREALAAADAADRAVARGEALGPLHGLPTAVKDLMDVAGLPTTHGSLAHADAPPAARDSVLAERLRRAGAIILGKTNTPEAGLGVLSFNEVFGVTRNPWALDRHAGGSSGGAAAALAAGMVPIADGSDSGGSIRYPAAFCRVVGLRPSAGRVPSGRAGDAWDPHAVLGPMARDSRDAALLLEGIAGLDDRWPLGLRPERYAGLEPRPLTGLRIAWSADLGGLPIDPEIRRVHAEARRRLEDLGCVVTDAEPPLDGVDEAWETIELFNFFAYGREDVARHRDLLRPDYVRNVEEGARITADRLARAYARRTELHRATAALLREHDVLITPATPVPAPPVDVEWVREIDGVEFDRYFVWQRCATRVTAMAHPALVTPAGFTADGLPVGLQLVGRHREDAALLRIGAAVEDGFGHRILDPLNDDLDPLTLGP